MFALKSIARLTWTDRSNIIEQNIWVFISLHQHNADLCPRNTCNYSSVYAEHPGLYELEWNTKHGLDTLVLPIINRLWSHSAMDFLSDSTHQRIIVCRWRYQGVIKHSNPYETHKIMTFSQGLQSFMTFWARWGRRKSDLFLRSIITGIQYGLTPARLWIHINYT